MTKTMVPAHSVEALMTERLLQYLEIRVNNTNPTYQVDINSCIVGSDDGSVIMEVSSPITVDITASGANGLDTGSEASSTWYYIYMIYNPTTNTVAGLFSVSQSSPTMPSGYTKKRLVGCVRNDGSSNFLAFAQNNQRVTYYGQHFVLSGGTAGSWTSIDLSNHVPTNIAYEHCFFLYGNSGGDDTSGNAAIYLSVEGSTTSAFYNAMRRQAAGNWRFNSMSHPSTMPVYNRASPNVYYYIAKTAGTPDGYMAVIGFILNV